MMKRFIWVLWPSFIVAGVAVGLFFTVIDPEELYLFGEPIRFSRMATYSLGFFCFWAICAASSMLTCYIQRTAEEVNRCPLPAPRGPRVVRSAKSRAAADPLLSRAYQPGPTSR